MNEKSAALFNGNSQDSFNLLGNQLRSHNVTPIRNIASGTFDISSLPSSKKELPHYHFLSLNDDDKSN